MDPITLATLTAAVSTLGMEAMKATASEAGKSVWEKVKGWLGFEKTPGVEDMAHEVATALVKNGQAAEQVLTELKKADAGTASRMVQKTVVTNSTGTMTAGRDNFDFKGATITTGDNTKFGGS